MGNFREVINIAKENNAMSDFYNILDDYFKELEKHHPNVYENIMKEFYKLGEPINIKDENELKKYLKHINHKDVPELWTLEQTTKVGEDIGIDFNNWKYNKYTFNYVMNMIRSDYFNEFKKIFSTSPLMKQTILDSPTFYAHMAKAWLDDEDAPEDKVLKYIHIVTGEEI